MRGLRIAGCVASAAMCVLTGCHHRAPVRAAVPPPPPPTTAEPVMVSVPPPTHRSTVQRGDVLTSSSIPVLHPVRPPKKPPKRARPATQVAVNNAPAAPPPAVSPPPPPPARSLGQLTTSTEDPSVTREAAAQALRREQERIAAIPGAVQAAHASEIEQAKRFVKSASDSWNASDYAATVALSTKARVLLDDLLK